MIPLPHEQHIRLFGFWSHGAKCKAVVMSGRHIFYRNSKAHSWDLTSAFLVTVSGSWRSEQEMRPAAAFHRFLLSRLSNTSSKQALVDDLWGQHCSGYNSPHSKSNTSSSDSFFPSDVNMWRWDDRVDSAFSLCLDYSCCFQEWDM